MTAGGERFGAIVRGPADGTRHPAVAARGTGQRGIRSQQDQAARAGDAADAGEQRTALAGGRGVVAEDDAAAGWHARQHRPERVADPLVGQQPALGVCVRHGAAYSARMDEQDSAGRLAAIHARIAGAAKLAGRKADDVALVAISKTQPAEAIDPLLAAGQRRFGENRVQEAEAKWPALKARYPDVELHLVGQLQSNKAGDAVALFDAIHSVDRPSLVTALGAAMAKAGRRPACFVQVNIGDEAQKGGCAVKDLPALLGSAEQAGLPVVGLMAVPPAGVEAAPYFALLAKLAREHGLERLSMGMSDDLETAVTLGATEVRVGTALFGARA